MLSYSSVSVTLAFPYLVHSTPCRPLVAILIDLLLYLFSVSVASCSGPWNPSSIGRALRSHSQYDQPLRARYQVAMWLSTRSSSSSQDSVLSGGALVALISTLLDAGEGVSRDRSWSNSWGIQRDCPPVLPQATTLDSRSMTPGGGR